MNFTPTLGIQALNLLAGHLGFAVPSAPISSEIKIMGEIRLEHSYEFDLPLNQYVKIAFRPAFNGGLESKIGQLDLAKGAIQGSGARAYELLQCSLNLAIDFDGRSKEPSDIVLHKSFRVNKSLIEHIELGCRYSGGHRSFSLSHGVFSCNISDHVSLAAKYDYNIDRNDNNLSRTSANVLVSRSPGFYDIKPFSTSSSRYLLNALNMERLMKSLHLFVPDPQHGFTDPFLDPVKAFEWGAGLYLTVQTTDGIRKFADFGLEAFRNG